MNAANGTCKIVRPKSCISRLNLVYLHNGKKQLNR